MKLNNKLIKDYFKNSKNNSTTDTYSCDYNNKAFGGKILWTNSSPSTAMGENVEINLSSSDYDVLEIFYSATTTNANVLTTKTIKGKDIKLNNVIFGGGGIEGEYRTLTYVNATKYKSTNSTYGRNVVTHNDGCIPLYIVGYKTGLF